MMKILTKQYIHRYKTGASGWTKSQIEALGLSWPVKKGWIDALEGSMITDENAKLFESKLTLKQAKAASLNNSMNLNSE